MKKKEKVSVWMENHSGLIGFCRLIIGLITLVITITLAWRLIGKMIVLIIIFVIMAISLFVVIQSAIFLIRKPLNEEIKKLKSEYDGLVKLTKLPKTFDRAITVERSPDWGVSTPIIIPTGRHGKYTHLRFDMRVINRTFYPFETEEVAVSCFCYQKGFYKNVHNDSWDKKTHKSETIEVRKDLPVWGQGDGFIMFHVPIKELYDDMEIWRLNGMVKYKSKEPLIDDDNQYANPEIDIEIEYMLPEKQISELKKEVEKALGDEV